MIIIVSTVTSELLIGTVVYIKFASLYSSETYKSISYKIF